MLFHLTFLAILLSFLPSICAPLPLTLPANNNYNNHLSTRQSVTVPNTSFDPDTRAAIAEKRAQGREVATESALAEEKKAYELEVSHGNDDHLVVWRSRSEWDIVEAEDV